MFRLIIFLLLALIVPPRAAVAGSGFCRVKVFDEDDGLSQRLVKGVVQDEDGVIWIATWNGLNRYDGNEFVSIRPGRDDEASRYSSRIGDVKLSPDGWILCRVDNRILAFDPRTHRFADIHADIERSLGRRFSVKQILTTADGPVVISCTDGGYIILIEGGVKWSAERPRYKYTSLGNRKLGDVGPYRHDDLVLSRRDADGTVRLITRDGLVVSSPSVDGPFTELARIDVPEGSLYYCTTDRQGNVWLRSTAGAVRVTFGVHPYEELTPARPSMVRASMLDSRGRLWLSESDARAVAVLSGDGYARRQYLRPDGRLSDTFTPFGESVYSFCESADGSVWLGTKPSGIFRLAPDGSVTHFPPTAGSDHAPQGGNIYDIVPDSRGRLWLATMGQGVEMIPDPQSARPRFIHFADLPGYPAGAQSVRHLALAGDTLLIGSTTSGLLVMRMPVTDTPVRVEGHLHVSEPGREASLGNVAVMDVALSQSGRLVASTESDGLNLLLSPLAVADTLWNFRHLNSRAGGMPDVTLSAVFIPGSDEVMVVSNNGIHLIGADGSGTPRSMGPSWWGRKIRFSDARPLRLPDGRWLMGHDDGAVIVDVADRRPAARKVPLMFTSASVENRRDTLLSMACDTLVLSQSERNMTLRFSALDYLSAPDVRYEFRFDGEDWNDMGHTRAVTLLDLAPGTYRLEVRSTDSAGRMLDNARRMTLVVTPTFWETGLARVLYILAALMVAGGILWTVVYIRRIRRKQRETLKAYLDLLQPVVQAPVPEEPVAPSASLKDDDRQLMDKVMEFVETHLGDSEVSVDDMAAAAGVSRSGLNRKMKSLMGVTPAEFLRESRLGRAASLLVETDRPIKEIALDCGFSDLNYFGKCFKASRSMTPGAFRKSATGK